MESTDSFWQWGNARKKLAFSEINFAPDGSSKISAIAGGLFLNTPKEENLLKRSQCMDAAYARRYQRTSKVDASEFGDLCRDVVQLVESSTMQVILSKNEDAIEANSSKSPTSVFRGPNISSSSDTISNNSDTISCHPHGDLKPRLLCSGEVLGQDRVLCDQNQPSKLKVWRNGLKLGLEQSCCLSDEGIHDSFTGCDRETSMEASSACSISKAETEHTNLQSQSMKGEIRNVRPTCGSEPSSICTALFRKRPKRRQSLISKNSFEIQKESSEVLFEALHMLADIVVESLVSDYKEKETEAKASSERWTRKEIFHPIGVSFCQKRIIRRAKNAFKSHSPQDKLMAADSERPFKSHKIIVSKLGSPECIETNKHQVMDGDVADKDPEVIQTVRSSKRTRSQFLNSEYCDSVLEPLKKGYPCYFFLDILLEIASVKVSERVAKISHNGVPKKLGKEQEECTQQVGNSHGDPSKIGGFRSQTRGGQN
ncbi:hypothetical protein SUGI_0633850 [Cryptomeria japonica]|nr:hypothetical protein SUGI_0633850 [Cryptomeria japonica]